VPRAPAVGPDLIRERVAWLAGYRIVAGVDEVGVGAIAGPVVAAAVVLPSQDFDGLAQALEGVRDSKRIWGKSGSDRDSKREPLYDRIVEAAQHWRISCAVGVVEVAELDALDGGGHSASMLACRRALGNLPVPADYVLFDGGDLLVGCPAPCEPIAKGDSTCLSIAAASIIAKVTRDRRLNNLAELYPDYHFEDHKGYPSRTRIGEGHLDVLQRLGPLLGVHHYSDKWIRRLLSSL